MLKNAILLFCAPLLSQTGVGKNALIRMQNFVTLFLKKPAQDVDFFVN